MLPIADVRLAKCSRHPRMSVACSELSFPKLDRMFRLSAPPRAVQLKEKAQEVSVTISSTALSLAWMTRKDGERRVLLSAHPVALLEESDCVVRAPDRVSNHISI